MEHSSKGEVLSIGVGGCGLNLLDTVYTHLEREHYSQKEDEFASLRGRYRSMFFNETEQSHSARAILCDMGSESIDETLQRNVLFNPSMSVHANSFSKGIYPVARYNEGAVEKQELDQKIRKIMESCDSHLSFWIFNSLSGGSGSGIGALLSVVLRQEYSYLLNHYWSLFPLEQISMSVHQAYNTVLSFHLLVEHCDAVTYFDNSALMRQATFLMQTKKPTFSDLNEIVAKGILDVSSSWRLAGDLNSSIRKSLVNLIPFPRMHFFANSVTPIGAKSKPARIADLFCDQNILSDCNFDSTSKSMFTQYVVGRGIPHSVVQEDTLSYQLKKNSLFKEWLPYAYGIAHSSVPNSDERASCAALLNTPALINVLKNISTWFTEMFRRKAFLHHYTEEGMDEMEFTEAESNMNDLVSEYEAIITPYGAYFPEEEDDYDE